MKDFRHRSIAIRAAPPPLVAMGNLPAPYRSLLVEVAAQALWNTESDERAAVVCKRGGPSQTTSLPTLTARLTEQELGLGAGIGYRLARESTVRDAS